MISIEVAERIGKASAAYFDRHLKSLGCCSALNVFIRNLYFVNSRAKCIALAECHYVRCRTVMFGSAFDMWASPIAPRPVCMSCRLVGVIFHDLNQQRPFSTGISRLALEHQNASV